MCRPWCRPTVGRVHHNVRSTVATARRNHCGPWSAPARPRRFADLHWYRRAGGVGRTLVRVTETRLFVAVMVTTAVIPVRRFEQLLARLGDVGVCREDSQVINVLYHLMIISCRQDKLWLWAFTYWTWTAERRVHVTTQRLSINCGEESELLLRDPTRLEATGNRRVRYFHEMSHTLSELVSKLLPWDVAYTLGTNE